MVATLVDAETVTAAHEWDALARLSRALHESRPAKLVIDGDVLDVPAPLVALLVRCVEALEHDRAVTLVPMDGLLSRQEAADLLNVPRAYLDRLLEEGVLPAAGVGRQSRVLARDLLAYRTERDARRREHLRELTRLGQALQGDTADTAD